MGDQIISFNAGPSYLAPRTIQALHDIVSSGFLSTSHRSDEFSAMTKKAVDNLRKQMRIPNHFRIFFQPSAIASMDTILQNVVKKQSFHFVNGDFSERFYTTALQLDLDSKAHQTPGNAPIDWQNAKVPKGTELIAITHNETRMGNMWPVEEIKKLRQAYPDVLLVIDVTSSFGSLVMDWNLGDIWFSSVQKCLGMPPGMAVMLVNEKAFQRGLELKKKIPPWRRFDILAEQMKKFQMFETPNLLAIALLAKQMEEWDLDQIDKETKRKARLLYTAEMDWTSHVQDPAWQSITVTHFVVDNAEKWHSKAKAANFGLGYVFGDYAQKGIRISNFPQHTYEMMEKLLEALKK